MTAKREQPLMSALAMLTLGLATSTALAGPGPNGIGSAQTIHPHVVEGPLPPTIVPLYVHCPADLNGDAFVDAVDIDMWNAAMSSGEVPDLNGDGFGDALDIDTFNAGLLGGCVYTSSADLNEDGFVDAIDLDLWTSAFIQGDALADVNKDGFVDAMDYDSVIAAMVEAWGSR